MSRDKWLTFERLNTSMIYMNRQRRKEAKSRSDKVENSVRITARVPRDIVDALPENFRERSDLIRTILRMHLNAMGLLGKEKK